MNIKYTDYFLGRLKKRLQKSPHIRKKLTKQIKLLQNNIKHPSLKVHILKGKRAEEFSFWVEGNLRITFIVRVGYYLFTDIITHDEY